jgi:hypothetical protein
MKTSVVIINLLSFLSIVTAVCVRGSQECPQGTHPENEPEICRDEGYPPDYHLLCVGGQRKT